MKNQRSGFTLVELLVVITIIGILMGLLIPAVNAARETARRNQCATQIKNLALAAIQYENNKGELPGYVQRFGAFGTVSSTGVYSNADDPSESTVESVVPHVKLGTWAVAILPWLDAQPTYEHWTEDRYPIVTLAGGEYEPSNDSQFAGVGYHPLAAPSLAIMQCPSSPVTEGEIGQNSYVSNNGFQHLTITSSTVAARMPFKDAQARANGIFNSKYDRTATADAEPGPAFRLTDIKDGAGNTMLFSENLQALPWHRVGFADTTNFGSTTGELTARMQSVTTGGTPTQIAGSVVMASARFTNGMVWHYEDQNSATTMSGTLGVAAAVDTAHRINGGGTTASEDIFTRVIEEDNLEDAADLARPSSAHVDGVNAGFADGQTRFVTESVDYRVYQALLTPRGKSSDVPWPEYILNEEAL